MEFFHTTIGGPGWEPAASVRPPAVAGAFYPAEPAALRAMLDQLFTATPAPPKLPGPICAMIAPHAGYDYSGRAAAANFKLLQPGQFSRVILLGPSHYLAFHGASVPSFSAFATPLGEVPVDTEAVAELRRCDVVNNKAEPHEREHSLEVELPFLQKALGQFNLVPVVMGSMTAADCEAFASALLPLWDKRTLLVVSSDFCHYGPAHRYEPFGKGGREPIAQLDTAALEQILTVNPRGFDDYLTVSQNTICGRVPILELLMMARQRSIPPQPVLTAYYMSGDLNGDYENSVSYASVVFCETDEPWNAVATPAQPLNEHEQRALLKLARSIVEQIARGQGNLSLDPRGMTPNVMRPGAAFVTLTKEGQLRGCIGSVVAMEPLALSVAHNAMNASSQDPRFPAVRASELPRISIEVNVLAPPHPMGRGIEDFVLGKHGLIIEKDGRRGLFLPEVMSSQGWTPEETLSQLCRKAGLPLDAWRSGYKLYGFETQSFHETEPGKA